MRALLRECIERLVEAGIMECNGAKSVRPPGSIQPLASYYLIDQCRIQTKYALCWVLYALILQILVRSPTLLLRPTSRNSAKSAMITDSQFLLPVTFFSP